MSNEICSGDFMHKIKINGYFKNSDMDTTVNYDCYGKKINNIIEFNNGLDVITIRIEKEKISFKRENDDIIMFYEFNLRENTTNNSYRLKKENLELKFVIETKKIKNTDNEIFIEFKLLEIDNNSNYQLSLNYKVV